MNSVGPANKTSYQQVSVPSAAIQQWSNGRRNPMANPLASRYNDSVDLYQDICRQTFEWNELHSVLAGVNNGVFSDSFSRRLRIHIRAAMNR